MIVTKNEIKSMIYGLAVGDAMGVPVEFTSRAKLEKEPVKEMLILLLKSYVKIFYLSRVVF